ncbi:endolytic transglycosylase MltG [Haliangium ochraceum]|uniref:Endolytic murein transglycosylase n=1 Tax=Haliangium ochraceum (strain DSM 14365 / JCM 11303 / SMP-2) TaxID=502025 RepID=D0LRC0_HALO1|nr:endolytic transglycosylase MltG [Haliangium ochraceum]ACY17148.1 aminodeoxychorismate lyase [Haliangium ochraceum DSM 14365]
MSKRSFRVALVVVLVSVIIAGVVVTAMLNQALSYPQQPHEGAASPIAVSIERGMSFPRIARVLHEQGIIDKPRWFRIYAMQRGVTTRVRSGDYELRGDMTPKQVLDALLEGVAEETTRVTVPEGLHMLEVFAIIDKAGVADAAELEAMARDREFLDEHGIGADTVEGYLFPDTYRFRKPSRPAQVLETMIDQHRAVWAEVRRKNERGIDKLRRKLGWSERDILTMASIVEKEAAVAEERPRIAQVFINRLTSPNFQPKRLETDPTIRYGCTIPVEKSAGCLKWDPSQRLRRAQLDDRDNPYNTYQHEGLPPGPIANPGRAALEATVDPDGSNFFFFVARNDGTHVFSRTIQEHERYVDEFQR